MKKTWSVLSEVIKKSKKKNTLPQSFIINNTESTNAQEIAEGFNLFFTNIGQNLSNNIANLTTFL